MIELFPLVDFFGLSFAFLGKIAGFLTKAIPVVGTIATAWSAIEMAKASRRAGRAQQQAVEAQKQAAEEQLKLEREKYEDQKRRLATAEQIAEQEGRRLGESLGFRGGGFFLPEAELLSASEAGKAFQEQFRRRMMNLPYRIPPSAMATLIANANLQRDLQLGNMAAEAKRRGAAQLAGFRTQGAMQLAGLGGSVQTPNVVGAYAPYTEALFRGAEATERRGLSSNQMIAELVGGLANAFAERERMRAFQSQLQNLYRPTAPSRPTVPTAADLIAMLPLPRRRGF